MTHLGKHVMCLCSVSLLCTVRCVSSVLNPLLVLLLMGMFNFSVLWNSSVTFSLAPICVVGPFSMIIAQYGVGVCIVLVHFIHYILYIFGTLIIYYSHNVLG